MTKFTPRASRPPPLAEQVVQTLYGDIKSGRFSAGDRLPTESELAQSFGVSRGIIREAAAQLRADGLIVSRQGAGLFVAAAPTQRTFRIPDRSLGDRMLLREIFELRLGLEVEASGLAALRCTKTLSKEIAAEIEAIEATRAGPDFGVAADIRFHRAIAAATANTKILGFHDYISGLLARCIEAARGNTSRVPSAVDGVMEEHRAIFRAIAGGEPEKARNAMRAHLEAAQKRLCLPSADSRKRNTKKS